MKNLLLILIASTLISCEATLEEQIIGQWQLMYDTPEQQITLTFNEDYTGTLTITHNDYQETQKTEWRFNDNELTIEFPEQQTMTFITEVKLETCKMHWEIYNDKGWYWIRD